MLFYGKETTTKTAIQSFAGTTQEAHYSSYDNMGRLDAATAIDFTTQMYYSSDNLVGYEYVIDVKGNLLNFDLANNHGQNFPDKLKRIQRMTQLLNRQGGALFYTDEKHNILFVARGCSLKSLSFDEEPGWTKSVPYSFQMVASEINFFTDEVAPDGIIENTYSAGLVDGKKFKIKEFSDNISYNFNEGLFDDIYYVDPEVTYYPTIENMTINFTYDISAVGINYTTNDQGALIPAWEQARLFCQHRLRDKIEALSNSLNARALSMDIGATDCNATRSLDTLYTDNGNASNAVLDSGMVFKVYNEEITTNTSESAGSFSVKYTAILKRGTLPYIHKVSKTLNDSVDSANKQYSLKGTVQGLVRGGLFFGDDYGDIRFPDTGYFLIGNSSNGSINVKFDAAQRGFSQITDTNETDLNDTTKDQLGITHALLTNPNNDTVFCRGYPDAYPRSTSFTVQKNWNEGTIDWTAEFNANTDCGRVYSSIEFSINRETPVIAELSIPNGSTITPMNPLGIGHRLVYIGTTTNPTMDITIRGIDRTQRYCCLGTNAGSSIANFLYNSNGPNIPSADLANIIPSTLNNILTRSSKNLNINTGEYTINLSYILCTPGCYITQGL